MGRGRPLPLFLLLVLCLASWVPIASSFAARAKKPKKVKAATTSARGFGAANAAAGSGKRPPLPTLGNAALDQAMAARCAALLKQPKQPQLWLELGSILVKAGEYAEADRVFRAGAARLPANEMLSAAALTLGGDSAAYCAQGAVPATTPPANAIDDASFDGYEAPAAEMLTYDQVDRHVDWSTGKERLASRGTVFKTRDALLDPADCAWVINQVEAHAAVSGWTRDRHVQAPTTDIPVSQVPAIREWFDEALTSTLFPMVASRFPHAISDPAQLRVLDAFVVRYDAREQASLPTHVDENTFSFTIALNDRSEYEGGGTYFERLRPVGDASAPFEPTTLNADAGGCVAFPGKLRHGGSVVTAGRFTRDARAGTHGRMERFAQHLGLHRSLLAPPCRPRDSSHAHPDPKPHKGCRPQV